MRKVTGKSIIQVSKEKAISFVLLASLAISLLSGCTNRDSFSPSKPTETSSRPAITSEEPKKEIESDLENVISTAPIIEVATEEMEEAILNIEALISQPTNYSYDFLYDPNHILDLLEKVPDHIDHGDINIDLMNDTALAELVMRNKTSFDPLSEKTLDDYELDDFYTKEETIEICSDIINHFENIAKDFTDFDRENLMCVLKNLKIYEGTHKKSDDVIGVYENITTTFIIFEEAIRKAYAQESGRYSFDQHDPDYLSYRRGLLQHEAYHLLQEVCHHADIYLGDEYDLFGMSVFRNSHDTEVNFLHLEEAFAEDSTANPYTYEDLRVLSEALRFVCSINPNNDMAKINNMTLYGSPLKTMEALDINTREEQIRFAKMNTSFAIGQGRNIILWLAVEAAGGSLDSSDEFVSEIRWQITREATAELARLFYKNLLEINKNCNITLEENLYLMRLFESKINYCDFIFDSEYENNKELGELINTYSNAFFRYFAAKYGNQEIRIANTHKTINLSNDMVSDTSFRWLSPVSADYIKAQKEDMEILSLLDMFKYAKRIYLESHPGAETLTKNP